MFQVQKLFCNAYDVPDTDYTYPRLGSPSGHPITGREFVQTSGSSTTVTAYQGTPFAPVTVGSLITFRVPPDTSYVRHVTAKASSSSITIDTAVNLASPAKFDFYPFASGQTDSDGWHYVGDLSAITVYVQANTIASTGGIDVVIEGGGGDQASPVVLEDPINISVAGSYAIPVTKVANFIRVGLKAHTSDAAGDDVDVWLVGEQLLAKGA